MLYLTLLLGKCLCEYCGSSIDISEFELNGYEKEKQKAYATASSSSVETVGLNESIANSNLDSSLLYDEFYCESCGAKLITDKTTTITRCVFCGSQQMIKQRLVGKFEPQSIIPFKIDKNGFLNTYKSFIKKMKLAPNEYRNNPSIDETRGLYVPFHLFRYNVTTYGRGYGEYRSDKNTYRKWLEYKSNSDVLVPIDGSQRLDDNIMSSLEPFRIQEIEKFNPAYITGFQSECTDEADEVLIDKAERRVVSNSVNEVRAKFGRYHQKYGYISSDMKETESKEYTLLPVWFVNSWYKNKKYSYAVNGQTGKVVGEVPLSKPKFYSLMAFLISIALILTLAIFMPAFASSYDDDDDDSGSALAMIWGGIVVAPYVYIKKKYKNISHVYNIILPRNNYNILIDNTFKKEKEYKNNFPDDNTKQIICQRIKDGKLIEDFDFNSYSNVAKNFESKHVSVNNKNL